MFNCSFFLNFCSICFISLEVLLLSFDSECPLLELFGILIVSALLASESLLFGPLWVPRLSDVDGSIIFLVCSRVVIFVRLLAVSYIGGETVTLDFEHVNI
jgi:hypothetical protein